MKSNLSDTAERKELAKLHSDCRSWRRVAFECARAEALIPPSTEEQYRVIHGRILARCRNLANEEVLPASRRQIALQLDELLRPWPSAQSLKEAPANIVSDLVKSQSILDEQLSGKRRFALGPLGRLMLTAMLAALGGVVIVAFLQWTNSNPAAQAQPLGEWLGSIVAYVGRTSFTERFAVAILVSWLIGTWLLSRLSKS